MIGKHRIAASQQHDLRLARALACALALALAGAFALIAASSSPLQAAPAVAASPPAVLLHRGLRWIGTTTRCASLPDWTAELVFQNAKVLGPGAGDLCLYKWSLLRPPPTSAAVDDLFARSGVPDLIEDVPVVEPMDATPASSWSDEELDFYAGLRTSLLQHVGTAALLQSAFPQTPTARVVVLDTAPDAPHAGIHPGASRHGDTLAHLISDIVCLPPVGGAPRRCAAEVTTELAMPWMAAGVLGPDGGHTGTLVDLARAIERAIVHWDRDMLADPRTPSRLILNLSLGWEHTLGTADCFADPATPAGLTAKLVQRVLQYATSRGVLVFSAAGNDSGGPAPRTKLTCPGSYQGLLSSTQPRPLLMAVSGVDYADRPLESVRSLGSTSLVGTSFGGMAWGIGDQAPPSLVGSSVGTAVVSAVAALVWAYQPGWNAGEVARAVYDGGVPVPGTPAQACPVSYACDTHRATACGALHAAGSSVSCTVAAAKAWSSPSLPAELAALIAALPGPPGAPIEVVTNPSLSSLPRFLAPSAQVEPWTFPMPIQATCPTCYASMAIPGEGAHLALRDLGKPLHQPMLVVRLDPGLPSSPLGAVKLGAFLDVGATLEVSLPPSWTLHSAYLTGFEDVLGTHSITEQIFVHR